MCYVSAFVYKLTEAGDSASPVNGFTAIFQPPDIGYDPLMSSVHFSSEPSL